jgi:primary-amine oxidase
VGFRQDWHSPPIAGGSPFRNPVRQGLPILTGSNGNGSEPWGSAQTRRGLLWRQIVVSRKGEEYDAPEDRAAAVMFPVTQPMWSQSPKHPLDGLTSREIWSAQEVLQASGKVDEKTQYPMVQLKEAPKEEVLAWKPGQAMRREAFLVVKQRPQTFEAVVDVNGKKLVSWTEIKGEQPKLLDEEDNGIDGAVKENAEIQAALKRRGINDLTTVFCSAGPAGYFGTQPEDGRRLLRVRCDDERGTVVGTGMPIEGLTGLCQ